MFLSSSSNTYQFFLPSPKQKKSTFFFSPWCFFSGFQLPSSLTFETMVKTTMLDPTNFRKKTYILGNVSCCPPFPVVTTDRISTVLVTNPGIPEKKQQTSVATITGKGDIAQNISTTVMLFNEKNPKNSFKFVLWDLLRWKSCPVT